MILRDKESKITAKEQYSDSYNATAKEYKLRTFGRYSLLISGATFFALGSANVLTLIMDIFRISQTISNDTANIGAAVVVNIIIYSITLSLIIAEILGGLAAISVYTGRLGKLSKLVMPFGITVFVLQIAMLVLGILFAAISFTQVLGAIVAALYLFGALILRFKKQ